MTAHSVAKSSGLNARRVSVLLTALEEIDVVERQGRAFELGRELKGRDLETFLAGFDARQQAERERLQTMIAYAESGMCRMQFLREYFGEPAGDACEHCDNCAQPASASLLVRPVQHQARIEEPAPQFTAGRQVRHSKFGSGEVIRAEEDQVIVSFVRHGEKRILASRLRPA